MDPYHYEYTYEELMTEGLCETPPVPPDSRRHAVWLAARARWPTVADARAARAAADAANAAANAASNSGNNNNNDNAWAGPATAEPQGLIDPLLLALAGYPAVAAPAPAPAPLPAPPAPAPPAAAAPAPAPAPGPAHPQPVVSAELQAILDAAVLGRRRAWTDPEDDYLRDARLAENSFAAIGNVLKRTGPACETRAKGRWYKGGKKPGDK